MKDNKRDKGSSYPKPRMIPKIKELFQEKSMEPGVLIRGRFLPLPRTQPRPPA